MLSRRSGQSVAAPLQVAPVLTMDRLKPFREVRVYLPEWPCITLKTVSDFRGVSGFLA
jgi:hypothetical protein